MRRFLARLSLLCLSLLGACSAASGRLPGESDARCIHRLYDYPTRTEPFPTAASTCAGGRVVDLTGDRYFQVLASSLNIPFVSHDPHGSDTIVLTGSRLAQPTDMPPPPQLSLH
jgi:hypothetical protein